MKSKQKRAAAKAPVVAPAPAADSRSGAGRPEYEPTDQERGQVRIMAGYGITHYEIALAIGISPPTLRKHFFRELEIGVVLAKTKAVRRLFAFMETNTKEGLTAAIFFLKCQAGWRDGSGPGEADAGKKDQQAKAAVDAGKNTEWGDDLVPPAGSALN